ncbi:MAG: hypothetical protein U1E63_12945 [Burkholderiales bacterium]
MKYYPLILATLLATRLLPAAAAEDWTLVTQTDHVALYVDTRSITSKDGVLRAWEKWEYASDRPGITATDRQPYHSARFLTHYDCRNRASVEVQKVFYDANGTVVGKVTEDPKSVRLTYVVPGLLSEAALDFVCKPRTPKKKKS